MKPSDAKRRKVKSRSKSRFSTDDESEGELQCNVDTELA